MRCPLDSAGGLFVEPGAARVFDLFGAGAEAKAAELEGGGKKVSLATIVVKNDYPEEASADAVQRVAAASPRVDSAAGHAAQDEKLSGVVLRLRSPQIGMAKAGEVRAAIARVRKAGKKVYADVHAIENLRD